MRIHNCGNAKDCEDAYAPVATVDLVPKETDDETYSARIAAAIDELATGREQIEVAQRLGIDQSAVSRMRQGKQLPRVRTLVALRRELGRSIDDILGLEPLPGAKTTDESVLLRKIAAAVGVNDTPSGASTRADADAMGLRKRVKRASDREDAREDAQRATDRPKARR